VHPLSVVRLFTYLLNKNCCGPAGIQRSATASLLDTGLSLTPLAFQASIVISNSVWCKFSMDKCCWWRHLVVGRTYYLAYSVASETLPMIYDFQAHLQAQLIMYLYLFNNLFISSCCKAIYTVWQKKLHPIYFLNDFVKSRSVLIILTRKYVNEFAKKTVTNYHLSL